MNNKFGKILVYWATFVVIVSIIIFFIFSSKIIWRDIKNSSSNSNSIIDLNR